MNTHKEIYKAILKSLSARNLPRRELLLETEAMLTGNPVHSRASVGHGTHLRALIGEVIDEMERGGVTLSNDGVYALVSSRPVILRAEKCEKAILDLLRTGPKNRQKIRSELEHSFGTDRTASTKDDQILYTFIGQVLKKLTSRGVLLLQNSLYSISPDKAARIDDIGEMLALKADFLTRLHSRGGEFFEHYFMSLISKFFERNGKRVTECYTTGGTADGGIDGVVATEDALGFRETVMVQTKNRLESTNETTARSFWGAVCAKDGSRGIFATTSDFHPEAKKFLDGIDNCVGVNGEAIFKMACECRYGIKKKKGVLVLDTKVI